MPFQSQKANRPARPALCAPYMYTYKFIFPQRSLPANQHPTALPFTFQRNKRDQHVRPSVPKRKNAQAAYAGGGSSKPASTPAPPPRALSSRTFREISFAILRIHACSRMPPAVSVGETASASCLDVLARPCAPEAAGRCAGRMGSGRGVGRGACRDRGASCCCLACCCGCGCGFSGVSGGVSISPSRRRWSEETARGVADAERSCVADGVVLSGASTTVLGRRRSTTRFLRRRWPLCGFDLVLRTE